MCAQNKIYTQEGGNYGNDMSHEDIVEQDLNDIFANYRIDEIVRVYVQMMSLKAALIPCIADEYYWPDHFDHKHFNKIKNEFETQYMKNYVFSKFTTKKSIVDCILGAYSAYGVGLPSVAVDLTKFKNELKMNHNKKTTTGEPSN